MSPAIKTRLLSSMEKCFPDEDIERKSPLDHISVLRGEQLSFQLACFRDAAVPFSCVDLQLGGSLAPYVRVRQVECIPSLMPAYPNSDDGYLRTVPGLYPDLLAPLQYGGRVSLPPNQLRSLWITLSLPDDLPAGEHTLSLELRDPTGEVLSHDDLQVELIDARLPEQTLIFTQWFHCDCLADYYGVEVFSEEHWAIIERFVRTAAENGINLLLTPVFTPPLDTEVGGERPTVQLVEVTREGEKYSFAFARLDRWIDMCDRCGIQYFEISHLFTQWGAAHAPKIMATAEGEYRRIFGWETDAAGEAYTAFLRQFIPAFLAHMRARGDDRRCFFHISDEPNAAQLEQYCASAAPVKELLRGYPIMDALSNFAFWEQGVVEMPIVSTNHIEPFLEAKVPGLWAYYCCAQNRDVSNRFFAMPGARTRIIGVQLYKYSIAGFLQWGYNFYFNRHSWDSVNPFLDSTGGCWVPSGDPYSVYPAPDGSAWESMRIVLFREALEDLRALQLCESLYGREYVLALIEDGLDTPLTFSRYPRDAEYLLNLRRRVNAAIAAAAKQA